jgi:DNA mismatch repair protein MutL
MVKVNEADLAVLGPHFPLLARLGLDIDQSGPDSLVIRSFPAVLPDIDLQLLLAGIIDSIKSPKSGPDNLPEGILELLADHGSVHVSKVYTLKDIEQEFRLFLTAQLPVRDKDCPGLWRTLSITDLQALVHTHASK